jgi:hypothetical protein
VSNVWIAILFAIIAVVIGYFLSQYWLPLGWLGFVTALGIVVLYIYGRNRRIQ